MATSAQRVYRAACPNCGAPVEFASAASASAVCSFCRSTLVRDGQTLRRIGVVADLFDDHSPLQLQATGKLQGLPFTLVGRLQFGYADGTWNEWHALFDNGRSGWLSEDNGAYVFAFDSALSSPAPAYESLRAGQRVAVAGQAWDVASTVRAKLVSAQGELPAPPNLAGEFGVVDLRNPIGEVGTLDYSRPQVTWSIGRSITLAELAMSGLKEDSEKTLSARGVECPNCGTSLEVKLATTQSITCTQCKSVVDLSKGVGADLAHYQQNNSGPPGGMEPQIALGTTGTVAFGGAPLPWQVVGFLERATVPSAGDDETYYWREYLLWNRAAGFAFLVDAEDGWSWVKPITGAPQVSGSGANWQGAAYRRSEGYAARVTWVQGEFYWRVQRDEQALVTDYVGVGLATKKRLSREQTGNEVTWSAGETMAAAEIAKAFGMTALAPGALARDTSPVSSKSGVPMAVILIIAIVLIVALVERCSSDNCSDLRATFGEASNEYRQCLRNGGSSGIGGGSFGGWSSGGGGHK